MAFEEVLREKIRDIVINVLREEGVYNSQAWLDGKIASVAGDGKHADVYINASTTATAGVPIAPHVGTLATNDEVVILRRAPRDLIIMFKKPL